MATLPARASTGRLYYGWVVLFVAYMISFFTFGLSQAFGVFLKPMTADFGWGRSQFALALSIFAIVSGIVPPIAGRYCDRHGPRPVLVVGTALNALGMTLMAFTPNLLFAYVVYGLIYGLGFGIAGQSITTALLSRWFDRRRGMALSVAATGIGAGQLVLAPLAAFIVVQASWRASFLITGLLSLALVPLCWVLLKHPAPGEEADLPNAGSTVNHAPAAACLGAELIRQETRQALRSRAFWLLAGGFMACGFTIYLLMTHVVALATDRGIGVGQAGTALGLIGGASIVSGLLMGSLSDRVGRKRLLAGLYLLRAMSVLVLMRADSATALYLFAALFGFSRANGALVFASVIDLYGRNAVGTIVGYTTTGHQLFAALGAFLGGLAYDVTGSYTIALAPCVALMLGAAGASLLVQEPDGAPGARQPAASLQPSTSAV